MLDVRPATPGDLDTIVSGNMNLAEESEQVRLDQATLRAGVAGLSENIRVRSIIGRFLEHSRVFYFLNDGAENVYLASADWMDRNFFRRIELAFPVLDPALKQRVIKEGLLAYLEDSPQTWLKNSEGEYERATPKRGRARMTQEELLFALAPG